MDAMRLAVERRDRHGGVMRLALAAALAFSALSYAPTSLAHSGGLNAEGCHNNRRTGDYHCHRPSRPNATRPGSRPASSAFANCAAARAAGAAPVRRGEPGYGPHLDRDNDGVGCE